LTDSKEIDSREIDRSVLQQAVYPIATTHRLHLRKQQQDPLNHQECGIGIIIIIGLIDKQQRSIITIVTSTYFVIIVFGRSI
jgi:hypothetical protein